MGIRRTISKNPDSGYTVYCDICWEAISSYKNIDDLTKDMRGKNWMSFEGKVTVCNRCQNLKGNEQNKKDQ